jgi:hypothetical protein
MLKLSIFFCIYCGKNNTGSGGHYYSLIETATLFLNKGIKVNIVILGNKFPSALKPFSENHSLRLHFLDFNNFTSMIKNVIKLIKREKPSTLHCFDTESFLYARIARHFESFNLILTKCGGPKPKYYFPKTDSLIVYSQKDFEYFTKIKYKNIHLIPNRVKYFKDDTVIVEKIKSLFIDKIIFLRICRISEFHFNSALISINLIKELISVNPSLADKVVVLIIGENKNDSLYKRLVSESTGLPVKILTDSSYTLNAKRIINAADFVIGTGRGVMEACTKSKPVLCISVNNNIPILLSNENFNIFFTENFSKRTHIDLDRKKELASIISLVDNKDKYMEFSLMSYIFFDKYFNIENAYAEYIDIYNKPSQNKYTFDTLLHFIFFQMVNLYTFFKRKQ